MLPSRVGAIHCVESVANSCVYINMVVYKKYTLCGTIRCIYILMYACVLMITMYILYYIYIDIYMYIDR